MCRKYLKKSVKFVKNLWKQNDQLQKQNFNLEIISKHQILSNWIYYSENNNEDIYQQFQLQIIPVNLFQERLNLQDLKEIQEYKNPYTTQYLYIRDKNVRKDYSLFQGFVYNFANQILIKLNENQEIFKTQEIIEAIENQDSQFLNQTISQKIESIFRKFYGKKAKCLYTALLKCLTYQKDQKLDFQSILNDLDSNYLDLVIELDEKQQQIKDLQRQNQNLQQQIDKNLIDQQNNINCRNEELQTQNLQLIQEIYTEYQKTINEIKNTLYNQQQQQLSNNNIALSKTQSNQQVNIQITDTQQDNKQIIIPESSERQFIDLPKQTEEPFNFDIENTSFINNNVLNQQNNIIQLLQYKQEELDEIQCRIQLETTQPLIANANTTNQNKECSAKCAKCCKNFISKVDTSLSTIQESDNSFHLQVVKKEQINNKKQTLTQKNKEKDKRQDSIFLQHVTSKLSHQIESQNYQAFQQIVEDKVSINCVCQVNDHLIASGGSDCQIKLWNWKTGEQEVPSPLLGHSNPIFCITLLESTYFNKNDYQSIIVSGTAGYGLVSLKIWEVRPTGYHIKQTLVKHNSSITAIILVDSDLKIFASASSDKQIILWSFDSHWDDGIPFKTLNGHMLSVLCLFNIFSTTPIPEMEGNVNLRKIGNQVLDDDNKKQFNYIASGSDDCTIKIWDWQQEEENVNPMTLIGHKAWVQTMTYMQDNNILATGSGDQTVKLWHLSNGQLIKTIKDHRGTVSALAYQKEQQILTSGSYDLNLICFDMKKMSVSDKFKAHEDTILSFNLLKSGKFAFSSSLDSTITLWKVKNTHIQANNTDARRPSQNIFIKPIISKNTELNNQNTSANNLKIKVPKVPNLLANQKQKPNKLQRRRSSMENL